MYHQFKELAGVDITAEAMEVGPTCHYIMGGVRVDADTTAATVPGLFAAGEVAGGMHGANRLGGNSLSDLLVFGRRAGIGAAEFAEGRAGDVDARRGPDPAGHRRRRRPFQREAGENPYDIQQALQETMQSLVGIIRTGSELEEALGKIEELEERAANLSVKGGTTYNPGWNLATDLPSMLTVSRLHDHGRPQPQGEPWRPDPRRLPEGRPRDGQGQLRRAHRRPVGRPDGRRRHAVGAVDHQSARTGPGDAGRPARTTRGGALMAEEIIRSNQSGEVTMRIWRGDEDGGEFTEYVMPAQEGEVVLDVIHRVQATEAPDLACRWNCKAGKCGSCSAEINGRPSLMCMTRMDTLPAGRDGDRRPDARVPDHP